LSYGRRDFSNRFTVNMQKKLVVLFLAVLLVFAGLSVQLYLITRDNGEEYKQKVLSQQEYDSTTIPFKRGNIVDSNGTILAVSNKVYNVILDTQCVDEQGGESVAFSGGFAKVFRNRHQRGEKLYCRTS